MGVNGKISPEKAKIIRKEGNFSTYPRTLHVLWKKSLSVGIHPAFLFVFRILISSVYYVIETLEEWLGKQWGQISQIPLYNSIYISLEAHVNLKKKGTPSRSFLMGILKYLLKTQ